jgi:hypothetical protein
MRLYIAAGVLLALCAAFLGGRFSAPVRVVESASAKQTSTAAAAVEQKNNATAVQDVTRHTERRKAPARPASAPVQTPAGLMCPECPAVDVEIVDERIGTRLTDLGTLRGAAVAASTSEAKSSRVVESARPGWRVSVAAGWDAEALSLRPETYGVEVSRRVAGTVWLGAWARTDRTGGVSVAVEF